MRRKMHQETKRQLLGTIRAMKVLAADNHKIEALALYRAITDDSFQAALAVYRVIVEVEEDSE